MASVAEGAEADIERAAAVRGATTGTFVTATVFADVDADMQIAQEEIFGRDLGYPAVLDKCTHTKSVWVALDR